MNKELRKEIGKFLVDVAKLVIGGVVLSSVIKIEGLSILNIIFAGITSAFILAVAGFLFLNIKEK